MPINCYHAMKLKQYLFETLRKKDMLLKIKLSGNAKLIKPNKGSAPRHTESEPFIL